MQVSDIGDWLDGLGLGQFAQVFRDQEIDGEVLAELTDDDLQAMGLPLGPRKKILRAITALRSDDAPPPRSQPKGLGGPAPPPRRGAERRNLTVLVCDLVGSTPLATRLDPEELRGILHGYMDACTAAVVEFGGYVARYQGDGLMAYFGYPQAREDAAERAVRTALRLVAAAHGVAAVPGVRLQSRVGIATGLAIVGDLIGEGAAREEAVVGETPALAARLQALAPPDGVILGENTRELVGNTFTLEALGPQVLKGFEQPRSAWRVLGEARAESRFAAGRGSDPGELVGRDSELAVLLSRWHLAVAGTGQAVLLSGEPGLGKSRLLEALRQALDGQPHELALLQCASYSQASALRPVIDWIERAAGIAADDPVDARLARLRQWPALSGAALSTVVELLSVAADAAPAHHQAERRERILNTLVTLLGNVSSGRPRLLVLEDAHWADASTLELLERVTVAARTRPLMLLVTARPEASMAWVATAGVTTIALDRLEPAHAELMIERLALDRLSAELRSRIAERAGGVPLFVEELTRSVLEAGAGAAPVPATLQDALTARLDRLRHAKVIAQTGAVLGREFHYRWLAGCAGISPPRLRRALAELVRSGLALSQGEPPEAVYSFKHALVQDAAYHSILRSERTRLHAEIARMLADQFARIAEDQPELVAHHYTEAGDAETSIVWWQRAAERALARAASVEAVRHLRTALDLLTELPPSADRVQYEIGLRRALVTPLVNLGGYSSPEAEANIDRLGLLLEDAPPSLEGVVLLYSQSALRLLRSDLDRAAEVAARTLRLARRCEVPNTPMLGQRILGYTALVRGDIDTASSWFTVSSDEYDPAVNREVWPGSPHDPVASMLAQDVLLLLQQGRLDEARRRGQAALAEAEQLGSMTTLGYVLVHLGLASVITGDATSAGPVARKLLDVVERTEWLRGHAESLTGWAQAKSGALDPGLARMRFGREVAERIHDRMWWPLYTLSEAELLIEHGRVEEALAILDQCRRMIALLGQSYVLAEMHRQRGVALDVAGASPAEVEAELETALATARRQGTRLYELRAATSLARWRSRTGRAVEAKALLAPVLHGFTEGLDAADLREALAMLAQTRSP